MSADSDGARLLASFEAELERMGMDELARLCRLGGLVGGHGEAERRDMVMRLTAAKAEQIVAASSSVSPARDGPSPLSRHPVLTSK